jgi:hypothetical protein
VDRPGATPPTRGTRTGGSPAALHARTVGRSAARRRRRGHPQSAARASWPDAPT